MYGVMSPKRDPQTGKYVSSGSSNPSNIVHRAHAWVTASEAEGEEFPLYVFQNPDVDRVIVGTMLQSAGPSVALLDEDGYHALELSFDADPAFLASPGNTDDTRSSTMHFAGLRWDQSQGIRQAGMETVVGQNAVWRRGTEVFLHSEIEAVDDSTCRATIFYVEDG